jgi:EF hand
MTKEATMVKIMAAVVVAVMLWAQGALAEDAGAALAEEMRRNPERFAARMTDLIAGFGQAGDLTREGIDDYIALERAGGRATALRRMMAMDLDADGTVTRNELAVTQRAASATTRGRMERQFLAADANGDGRVDAGELAADGKLAALRALGEEEAEMLRAVLTLDTGGDGALSQAELDAALARMDDAT